MQGPGHIYKPLKINEIFDNKGVAKDPNCKAGLTEICNFYLTN
jgi:hypothetical protein